MFQISHAPNARRNHLLPFRITPLQILPILTALFALSSCASTPLPPTSELQAAEQAIASAERSRVADYSSVELSVARDKLSAANVAVQEKKMMQARRLANESRANAELASARAEVAKAKAVNEQMQKGTDTLKMEMQRKTGDQ